MTPTILNGERVLINRLARTFKMPIYRGDIITFEKPDDTSADGRALYKERSGTMDFLVHNVLEINKVSYIKRVIGLAGDHILISNNGDVYVNDHKILPF